MAHEMKNTPVSLGVKFRTSMLVGINPFNFITDDIYFHFFNHKNPVGTANSDQNFTVEDSNTKFFPLVTKFEGFSSSGDEFWA